MLIRTILIFVMAASLLGNVFLGYQFFSSKNQAERRLLTLGEPIVMRTNGGLLEVSTVTALESFEASKDHTIMSVPIGKTVSQIRVPATYRYHIELAPEWKIFKNGLDLIVVPPAVKPSLPVAIDTGKLEAHSSGAWSLVTGTKLTELLQRSLTAELARKAMIPTYVQLQREYARKTVQEFVQKWAANQDGFRQIQSANIKVFFADERVESLLKP